MSTAREVATEVARQGRSLREFIPEVYRGYAALSKAAIDAEGELSPKVRELIALAIAVSEQCDGCISSTPAAPPRAVPVRRRWPRPSASP